MAAYIIIDNTDHAAWLKSRTYGIGGSDASAIVGLNPYKTNIELFEEKTGRRLPEDISEKPYVKYGTMAEPLIRELFRLDYPEYQVQYHENRILRSKKYPFLQASLDGELPEQFRDKAALEYMKSFSLSDALREGKRLEEMEKVMKERWQAQEKERASQSVQETSAEVSKPDKQEETAKEAVHQAAEQVLHLDFRVWGTRGQLMNLRKYMVENGLKFGKVE